jgi:hypothetical protein
MLVPARLWAKHIGTDSTGPLPYLTLTVWSIIVKGASFLAH